MASTPTANGHYQKPARGDKNWGTKADGLNANWDAADADHQGHLDREAAFDTDPNLVTGGYNDPEPAIATGNVGKEVSDSRGSLSTLNSRLNVGINSDGTLKAESFTYDQWEDAGLNTSTNTAQTTSVFRIVGVDATGLLVPGIRVRIDYLTPTETRYYSVRDSKVNGSDTDITVYDEDEDVRTTGTIDNVFTNAVKPWFYDGTATNFTPGPGLDAIREMQDTSFTNKYYNTSTFALPFTASTSTSNAGQLALIEYESGLKTGITYAALNGNILTQEHKVSKGGTDTLIETWTAVYDGTTDNLTTWTRS